ncbi:ABC transporter ATP-binding protein [Nocardia alba]|uniref:Nickel import system ATP-binding protein NikD n=1 Tax=Nocardia alba TaxID=225051 RepID=A0A4R1FNS6_9NOCA|nr:ATP-binding cassette domain-containing protein [Nocardia alba]TCJ96447.1 peptide/nickel transport system ATP-binding protein [Nocardia alba]
MTEPLISVRALRVSAGRTVLVDDIDLDVHAGEIVTLFGPSGAGKTTIATAIAGVAVAGTVVEGSVACRGPRDSVRIGYLPQHAASTLNPARRIGTALAELVRLRRHRLGAPRTDRATRRRHLADVLMAAAFNVPDEAIGAVLGKYPFEFSGGERARLALAQVLMSDPDVLIVDEPTVGLDPLARAALLTGLDRLRGLGKAVVLVTHDTVAVEQVSDRTLFVRAGRLHDSALPAPPAQSPPRRATRSTSPVLSLRDIVVSQRRSRVLHGVDLELYRGELVAMIGVSGAGKSTIGRAIAGLVTPQGGRVMLGGEPLPPLRRRSRAHIAAVQYVWQESAASFDPRRTVLDQVAATAIRLRGLDRDTARHRARALLDDLGIDERQAGRYPAGLSGGQLQRAALARALGAEPEVLVCDEITTALDAPLTDRILEYLDAYRHRADAAILMITHDLRIPLDRADRIVTVDAGRVTEVDVSADPADPILSRFLAADEVGHQRAIPNR